MAASEALRLVGRGALALTWSEEALWYGRLAMDVNKHS